MYTPGLNLDFTEQAVFALRELYSQYGYSQYRMGKFEEYDLYARNKDFLISDHVITFTDLNGKLMALKPDVTLSIVKNSTDRPVCLQKLYYDENVYRVSKGAPSFREIRQVGLECLGQIDEGCMAEVILLAARSLQRISPHAILSISHLGLLSQFLDSFNIPEDVKGQLLHCIGEKNLHELTAACQAAGIAPVDMDALAQLVTLSGAVQAVLPQLQQLLQGRTDDAELSSFVRILRSLADSDAGSVLRVDFSVVDNIHYYNGILFKGFIEGLPTSVLSGGQYDRLMGKMGRRSGAIGFAVYMDLIGRLEQPGSEYDVDTVLLYDKTADLSLLRQQADALRKEGNVLTVQQIPESITFRRLFKLQGSEVAELEYHA